MSAQWQTFIAENPWIAGVILLLAVWQIVWKGLALYRAGRVRDKGWFVLLTLVNTLGILDIVYRFVISKRPSRQRYLRD